MTSQPVIVSMYPHYDMNSAYIETRRRFAHNDLRNLRTINGVRSASVGDYTISLSFGSAFDYNELMAKCLKEVLGLLGASVDDVKLSSRGLPSKLDETRLQSVLALIKPVPEPVRRNPVAPFAATIDDVQPGVELMIVSYNKFHGYSLVTPLQKPKPVKGDTWSFPHKTQYGTSTTYLGDSGVLAHSGGSWSAFYFTIVNTAENRQKLVAWLLQQTSKEAHKTAQKIINDYLKEFVVVDIQSMPSGLFLVAELVVKASA